jgi:hypothetical protein
MNKTKVFFSLGALVLALSSFIANKSAKRFTSSVATIYIAQTVELMSNSGNNVFSATTTGGGTALKFKVFATSPVTYTAYSAPGTPEPGNAVYSNATF